MKFKHLNTMMAFVCFSVSIQAQEFKITFSSNAPVMGDSYSMEKLSNTSIAPNTYNGQINWDFSGNYPVIETVNYRYIRPSQSQMKSIIWTNGIDSIRPNLVLINDKNRDSSTYSVVQDSIILPSSEIKGKIVRFDAGFKITEMVYPFGLGDSFMDSCFISYPYAMGQFLSHQTVDGIGSILLPNGSFPALRVKTEINAIIHENYPGGSSYDTIQMTTYDWYISSEKHPIISINYSDNNKNGITKWSDTTIYRSGLSRVLDVEVNSANDAPLIGPNPFTNEVLIQNYVGSVHIEDMNGRIVLEKQVPVLSTVKLNTESLAEGFYALRLNSSNGPKNQVVKLIKTQQ